MLLYRIYSRIDFKTVFISGVRLKKAGKNRYKIILEEECLFRQLVIRLIIIGVVGLLVLLGSLFYVLATWLGFLKASLQHSQIV